jgi:protein-disulfide isomerase-like protein with CxxC motif
MDSTRALACMKAIQSASCRDGRDATDAAAVLEQRLAGIARVSPGP